MQAIVNVLLAKVHIKKKAGFKVQARQRPPCGACLRRGVRVLARTCGMADHPLVCACLPTALSSQPTDKTTGANTSLQIQAAVWGRLTSLTRRFNAATLPNLYAPQAQPTGEP